MKRKCHLTAMVATLVFLPIFSLKKLLPSLDLAIGKPVEYKDLRTFIPVFRKKFSYLRNTLVAAFLIAAGAL